MVRFRTTFLSLLLAAGMLSGSACAASGNYADGNSTMVSFTDSGADITGTSGGCKADGTAVSISKPGTYVFSGACADGSITVKKEVAGVTIVLDGLDLTSKTTSPVTLNKGSEAEVIAASGSQNVLSDTAGSNDENAVIKAKTGASLTLGGTGSLTVKGVVKNGIKGAAEAAVKVGELALTIESEDDGLSSDDQLEIHSGTIKISAGGDAIKASPDTDDAEAPDTVSKGNVTVSGGTLDLTSNGDAIQADGDLTVTGGTFTVKTNGGNKTALADDADSCKGFKAGKAVTVSGGTFNLDTADDALHSNGDVNVTGGVFSIASGDDALHADNALTVGTKDVVSDVSPKIDVTSSYEGLEGTTVTVYGGDIDVKASDDGINAANSDIGERSNLYAINIHGGNIYIDAGSDGLDSNYNITLDGGAVEVYGANRGMDCAIDYDGAFTLNGGTLLGAGFPPSSGTQPYVLAGEESRMPGGGGMRPDWQGGKNDGNGQPPMPPDGQNGQMPTPPNGQNEIKPGRQDGFTRPDKGERPDFGNGGFHGGGMQDLESAIGIKEGSEITIKDASGNTLYTASALGAMSNVIFSSSEVKEGETYTVYVDGESKGSAEAKLGTASSNAGGPPEAGMPQGNQQQSGAQNNSARQTISFNDVSDTDWFAPAVKYVVQAGLMNGVGDSSFAPEKHMSRAMFTTVLYRLIGENEIVSGGNFKDVPGNSYYAAAVAWASGKGIAGGTSAETFSPDADITREQLAVMFYRCAGAESKDGSLSAFKDADDVSSYAEDAVKWCVANGILTGKTSSALEPKGVASRAEVAAMIERFAKNYEDRL